MHGHGRPDRAALTLDVRGQGSCVATLRASALPVWMAYRGRLRLEWPTADQPAVRLHLYVGEDEIPSVERLVAYADGSICVLPAASDAQEPDEYQPCLREATDILFAALASSDRFEHAQRWHLVLTLVASGVQRALKSKARRHAYLAYHRDWLIRYPVLRRGLGRTKAQELLQVLETQRQQIGPLTWPRMTDRHWPRAVLDLCARATCPPDPFTSDPLFPVLFRLHHAVARLFGLPLLDEASLYHVLLAPDISTFTLVPHADRFPDPAATTVAAPLTSIEDEYPWRQLIVRWSADAAQWFAQYRDYERIAGPWLLDALTLLRTGRLDEGAALLQRVGDFCDTLPHDDRSFSNVFGRFRLGELAYYHYLLREYETADRLMAEAAESLRRAIDQHRFLCPIAPLLIDIPLQRARIASRCRDWPRVAAHLADLRQMEASESALCILSDGTQVDYNMIATALGEAVLAALHSQARQRLCDARTRLAAIWRAVARIYAVSGPAIVTSATRD